MSESDKKVCFVVMGFGKKTDYETGRVLDLDATYEAIIQPAVEANNMTCIRADEMIHSGIIDAPMYRLLLQADLVVADISTGNPNAVYELGVRHALRPNSTIIMKESEGRLHFDLNHVNTFQYEHMGQDIGSREATRAKAELQSLISTVLVEAKHDSPVYCFLPNLKQPMMSEEVFEAFVEQTEEHQDTIEKYIKAGREFLKNGEFDEAKKEFSSASKLKPDDAQIIQQLTLAIYKSEKPSKHTALMEAYATLCVLKPTKSNDPETLGLAGAISKRLWLITNDVEQLNLAITYYKRGFEIVKDYYNGENLALCYDYRSRTQTDDNEKLFDQMSAKKTRENVLKIVDELIDSDNLQDRVDRKWIYASKSICLLALNNRDSALKYENLFLQENPNEWEKETFNQSKTEILGES
jgi:tetratricopeptide (TPR) repeat protein